MTIQSGRIACLLTTGTLIINLTLPAFAANTPLQGAASRNTVKTSATKKFFNEHPKVRSATLGAGVGVAAGAVTGLVTGKGVGRGALIGAGAGAGVGAINSSDTLKRHPIMKTVATGTVAGLGLGLASSRGYGKTKKVSQMTAAGAAVGLGAALLKDKLR